MIIISYNQKKTYIAPPASLKRPCTHLASCQSKRASHQRSNHKKETDNLLWQLTAVGHGPKGSACQCQRHLVDCSGKQEHSMASDRKGPKVLLTSSAVVQVQVSSKQSEPKHAYVHMLLCPRTQTAWRSQYRHHNDLRGERLCVDRWAAHGSEPASSSAGSFSSAASLSPVPSTSCGDGSPLSAWRIRRTSRRSVLVS